MSEEFTAEQIVDIACQKPDVYQMPEGDWACACAGIISDGFEDPAAAELWGWRTLSDSIHKLAERIPHGTEPEALSAPETPDLPAPTQDTGQR